MTNFVNVCAQYSMPREPGFAPSSLIPGETTAEANISRLIPVAQRKLKASECRPLLEKYSDVLTLSSRAFAAFLNQETRSFDPLVGENGCQIRAYMLLTLSKSAIFLDQLNSKQKELQATRKRGESLFKNTVAFNSFDAYLNSNKLHVSLSEWQWIVLTSYVLTEGKAVHLIPDSSGMLKRQEKLAPEKILSESKISNSFKKELLRSSQIWLSELSVRFLQCEAAIDLNPHANWFFGKHVRKDQSRRIATPCFPAMKLILTRLRTINSMIALKVAVYQKGESTPYSVLHVTYKPRSKGGFKPRFMNHRKAASGALFIDAKSVTENRVKPKLLEEKIKAHELGQLMLSNAADHPQYGTDDANRPDDPELESARQFAREKGVSRKHPFPFFLPEHIYWGGIRDFVRGSQVADELRLSPGTTCEELYQILYKKENFPPCRLRLIYDGKALGESETSLCDKGFQDGSYLWAVTATHTPFQPLRPNQKYRVIFLGHDVNGST